MADWQPANKLQTLLSWIATSYGGFSEESFKSYHEQDPDEPLAFVLRYKTRFPFLDQGGAFDHFPKLELSFLRFPPGTGRTAPVYFRHPIEVESALEYQLPKGYGWKSLTLDREVTEGYLQWRFSIQQDAPEAIEIRQHWRIAPFIADAPEYREMMKAWEPVLNRGGLRLSISKQ
jgi:hypothetical protein